MTETVKDHLAFAKATYNQCWDLLDKDSLTGTDEIELLTAAFTSRYHWYAVGDERQRIISDWMVSRAAATVGDGPLAVRFAQLADGARYGSDQPAWLHASVLEGLARAYAANGDSVQRNQYVALAEAELAKEQDPEDAAVIAAQLATVPSVG